MIMYKMIKREEEFNKKDKGNRFLVLAYKTFQEH